MSFSGVFGGQTVSGGGGGAGVTQYASVTELLDAADAGLSAGYYEVPGLALVEWDGLVFSERLSRIQDYLANVVLWLDAGGQINDSGTPYAWPSRKADGRAVGWAGSAVSTLGSVQALDPGATWQDTNAAYAVSGAFEVFTTLKLDNNTDTNKGVVGTWSGSAGMILLGQDFAGSNGVALGVDGTYARATSRLGTAPHVVHGRYTGTALEVYVDGTIAGSAAYSGTSAPTTLYVGGYDINSLTRINGLIGHVVIMTGNRTDAQRNAIVAELLAEIV